MLVRGGRHADLRPDQRINCLVKGVVGTCRSRDPVTEPYPWPYDGQLVPARLAMVVIAGPPVPAGRPSSTLTAELAEIVCAAGGLVDRGAHRRAAPVPYGSVAQAVPDGAVAYRRRPAASVSRPDGTASTAPRWTPCCAGSAATTC